MIRKQDWEASSILSRGGTCEASRRLVARSFNSAWWSGPLRALSALQAWLFLHKQGVSSEMEFLDINLTKDSRLLKSFGHAIHSPFYWRILKKSILFSGLKNPHKNSAKPENSRLCMNSILQNGKMRVENQTKTQIWEDSSLCSETSTKICCSRVPSQSGTIWFIPVMTEFVKAAQQWINSTGTRSLRIIRQDSVNENFQSSNNAISLPDPKLDP